MVIAIVSHTPSVVALTQLQTTARAGGRCGVYRVRVGGGAAAPVHVVPPIGVSESRIRRKLGTRVPNEPLQSASGSARSSILVFIAQVETGLC